MHEFTIIYQVLKTVEKVAKENHLKKIDKITLKIGKLRQVVPDFLEFAFKTSAEGTIAEGAVLEIKEILIKIECTECHHQATVKQQTYLCPKCKQTKVKVISGKEILIDSIEGSS